MSAASVIEPIGDESLRLQEFQFLVRFHLTYELYKSDSDFGDSGSTVSRLPRYTSGFCLF